MNKQNYISRFVLGAQAPPSSSDARYNALGFENVLANSDSQVSFDGFKEKRKV